MPTGTARLQPPPPTRCLNRPAYDPGCADCGSVPVQNRRTRLSPFCPRSTRRWPSESKRWTPLDPQNIQAEAPNPPLSGNHRPGKYLSRPAKCRTGADTQRDRENATAKLTLRAANVLGDLALAKMLAPDYRRRPGVCTTLRRIPANRVCHFVGHRQWSSGEQLVSTYYSPALVLFSPFNR